MKLVKKYPFKNLILDFVGKNIHFTSDCEFFPNFNVKGKIISYYFRTNEIVFKLKTSYGKTIDVGTNMKNLKYEFI